MSCRSWLAWFERRVGVLQCLVGRIAVVVGLARFTLSPAASSCAVFMRVPVDRRCCVKPVGRRLAASSLSAVVGVAHRLTSSG